jgi:hypothetical protein
MVLAQRFHWPVAPLHSQQSQESLAGWDHYLLEVDSARAFTFCDSSMAGATVPM